MQHCALICINIVAFIEPQMTNQTNSLSPIHTQVQARTVGKVGLLRRLQNVLEAFERSTISKNSCPLTSLFWQYQLCNAAKLAITARCRPDPVGDIESYAPGLNKDLTPAIRAATRCE